MKRIHIITPVKDSIDSTLDTVRAIMSSDIKIPFTYTIYNDFSTPENTLRLEKASKEAIKNKLMAETKKLNEKDVKTFLDKTTSYDNR